MSERITSRDITSQDFRKKVRGYDPEDVQLYLKSLADQIERLTLDNEDLRDELARVRVERDQYRDRERTLQQTLISAQKMAEDVREQAETQSKLLLEEAQLKADRILQRAQEQLGKVEEDISKCRLERDTFERRLRGVIEQHLGLLEMRIDERDEPDNVTLFRSSRNEVG